MSNFENNRTINEGGNAMRHFITMTNKTVNGKRQSVTVGPKDATNNGKVVWMVGKYTPLNRTVQDTETNINKESFVSKDFMTVITNKDIVKPIEAKEEEVVEIPSFMKNRTQTSTVRRKKRVQKKKTPKKPSLFTLLIKHLIK